MKQIDIVFIGYTILALLHFVMSDFVASAESTSRARSNDLEEKRDIAKNPLSFLLLPASFTKSPTSLFKFVR